MSKKEIKVIIKKIMSSPIEIILIIMIIPFLIADLCFKNKEPLIILNYLNLQMRKLDFWIAK